VIWRLVSPFDGALSERPPQRVGTRSGNLEIEGLPLHLRSKEVVSSMISGFATMAEDVVVGLPEGNGRLLSVMVDVFIAGSIPDRLILRCGGSSWMLRLRFLVGDGVAKQCKSSEPATDEGVIAEELYMDLGDKSLAAETCTDLCDGETGMLQNKEMEELGGGELAGPSTKMVGDVLSCGRENQEQGNLDT
jgi:hypothetical protein